MKTRFLGLEVRLLVLVEGGSLSLVDAAPRSAESRWNNGGGGGSGGWSKEVELLPTVLGDVLAELSGVRRSRRTSAWNPKRSSTS